MGIDTNGVKGLLLAKSMGVDFGRIATVGRQVLFVRQDELKAILEQTGCHPTDDEVARIAPARTAEDSFGYADEFFRYLGVRELHSFDYSDYERATYLHDFNEPIPSRFAGCYDVVIDGGSLEHVFNFPVALKNCMEMVRAGGSYISLTPANNYLGHGFYQFSPELFFSVFTADNGYQLLGVFLHPNGPGQWFSVTSPASIRERVTLVNGVPVLICAIARRLAERPIFATMPQQSDYVVMWTGETNSTVGLARDGAESAPLWRNLRPRSIATSVITKLGRWKRILLLCRRALRDPRLPSECEDANFNSKFYQRFDPAEQIRRNATRSVAETSRLELETAPGATHGV